MRIKISKCIDLYGMKFGRLLVIGRSNNNKSGGARWLCRCDCGEYTIVQGYYLRNNRIRSCGCLQKEIFLKRCRTHGYSKTPTYNSWQAMRKRCEDSKNKDYQYYGGRGIKVCERWLKFENFLEDMGERPLGLTLDRKDFNGNYCKENCKWATTKEQQNNKRNNHYITRNGVTKTISEWSDIFNIEQRTVWKRLKRGWAEENIFD